MGKRKFDRKRAVRFTLVPGPEKDGKPSVLFRPVETKKSKLNKKEKKKMMSQFGQYDQITINGKVVDEDEIPLCVLEQIRGRKDLLFNQIKGNSMEQEEGDLYEIQDAFEEGEEQQYEQYSDYSEEEEDYIKEEAEKEEGSDDEWEDAEEEEREEKPKNKKIELKFTAEKEQFPTLEEVQTVSIDGNEYKLTKNQLKMLDEVLPQNYENIDLGIQFKKYNEDGLLLSDKQKYEKYILKDDQKVGIIDTYQYVPSKPSNYIDTDFDPKKVKSDSNLRQIEQALNYDGEEAIYEELQDDFFAKLIQGELQEKKKQVKPSKPNETKKNHKPKQTVKPQSKPQKTDQQVEAELEKAMFNFENNIDDKKDQKQQQSSSEQEEANEPQPIMNYRQLERRQDYFGRDGQLDWRMLTKKEKKQFMKTKVIRDGYEELRERQIEEKMKGKTNVAPEDLHLKKIIQHIPYPEDHVMQEALQREAKGVDEDEQSSYESVSDDDDIVSFHQKTSIIATNLSVIEEPRKEKKRKEKKQGDDESECNISKVKVVPERRNKNQTEQERKERKQKLKEMKKQKREQKKQFAERFTKIKKQTMKQDNPNNPMKGVAYVKIY